MRFLIDAQLPPKLAWALVEVGHLAEHLEDIGLRHAKDPAIWEYASREQAVIVSKDDDFADRIRRHPAGPIVVWLRIGNAANSVLLPWFFAALPSILARIQHGDRFIEVR